jgi:lipoyl(octanoyl) transferase
VSFHGVSLNVAPNLAHYDGIVPCGIAEFGVTSLSDLGVGASMKDVDMSLIAAFERVFGRIERVEDPLEAPARAL